MESTTPPKQTALSLLIVLALILLAGSGLLSYSTLRQSATSARPPGAAPSSQKLEAARQQVSTAHAAQQRYFKTRNARDLRLYRAAVAKASQHIKQSAGAAGSSTPAPAKAQLERTAMIVAGASVVGSLLLLGACIGLLRGRQPGAVDETSSGHDAAWRSLFDEGAGALAVLDRQGRILRSNRALQETFGYSAEQLQKMTLGSLTHPGDTPSDANRYGDLGAGTVQNYQVEQRYFRNDGEMIWARLTVTALRAEAAPSFALAAIEDITRRQLAETELGLTRAAIQSLYEVIADQNLDLGQKLHALLDMGCRRFSIETGVLGKISGHQFEVVAAVSPDKRLRPGLVDDLMGEEEQPGDDAAANALPLEHTGFSKDWREHPFFSVTENETYLGAPIIVNGQMYGIIMFSSPEPRAQAFDAGEIQLLQLMAQWAGSEVERSEARLALEANQAEVLAANAKLESLATMDGLTGVRNRRAFDEQLATEVERARRYQLPFSLVLLDVDKFKQFNDTFGHLAGDEVLKKVAKLLQATARTIDFVARYGGEEFVVLLPNTDRDGAIVLAERLREKLESAPWKQRAVTASFGIADLTDEIGPHSDLTAAADRALYHSKATGRNRVTHVRDIVAGTAPSNPE